MTARQRTAGLIFMAGLACLTLGVIGSDLGTAWAQRVYPVPSAPPVYGQSSVEPPLAGSSAPPQPAPAAPNYPSPRPVPAPRSLTPTVVRPLATPVVSLNVEVAATAAAGQDLEYRLCVQNRSAAPAHHVLVRNPLPAHARYIKATPEPTVREPELQWTLGTLPAGACKTIVLVLRPTGTGDVQDCARVQFEHGECVTTHIQGAPTTPPPAAPRATTTLTLDKRGPTTAVRYRPLDYELRVCNMGREAINEVKLVDTLPMGLDPVMDGKHAGAPHVSVDPVTKGNVLTWDIGTLPAGKCHTVTYQAIPKQVGKLTNTAVVTASGGLKREAHSTVTVSEPRVSLDAVGPHSRYVGSPTTYDLTVRNTGTTPLSHVVVNHPMPPGTTVLHTTAGGRFDGTTVHWYLGQMQPGAVCKMQITWRTPHVGRLSVHPVVQAEPGQTAQTDISTDFVAASALSLSVDDTDDPVEVNERTTYRITVSNQGQTPATNVRIMALAPREEKILPPTGTSRFQIDPEGRRITFEPVSVPAGQKLTIDVPVQPQAAGDVRFHVEMTADQLTSGKPVVEEESTTIYEDRPELRR